VTSSYYPGSLPPEYPDTPPGAEAKLAAYSDQLDSARKALRDARDKELAAKEIRDAARRRFLFDSKCPKVGVFDGIRTTVAYQTAWIEDRTASEDHDYQLAKMARQAAYDHLDTLSKQGSIQQTVTKSVSDSYRGTGRWS